MTHLPYAGQSSKHASPAKQQGTCANAPGARQPRGKPTGLKAGQAPRSQGDRNKPPFRWQGCRLQVGGSRSFTGGWSLEKAHTALPWSLLPHGASAALGQLTRL